MRHIEDYFGPIVKKIKPQFELIFAAYSVSKLISPKDWDGVVLVRGETSVN